MQAKKDFFSKVISAKTAVLTAMVCFLVIYTIIGIIMLFSSGTEVLASIAKILAPLGIIGIATILSVDCFYKMTSKENLVKIFGFITLILGTLDMILLTLMIWEIIPAYETSTSYGYYSYLFSTPTIAYKLVMSLLSLTGFTFLSSIVLSAKNNHKIINISKYIATGFLAIASLISIVSNFVDFSQQDALGSTRMGLLQAVSWITAICLGAAVFYLSKTISWESKSSEENSISGPEPSIKQSVVEQLALEQNSSAQPIMDESSPDPQPIINEPSPNLQSTTGNDDHTVATPAQPQEGSDPITENFSQQ